MKFVLTIAGSDSCGGAGMQADIKTITSLGAHALSVLTALTAQNSMGIAECLEVPAQFVRRQFESILEDVTPDAVKIGMLGTGENVREIAGLIGEGGIGPIVLDPVLKASTGSHLLDPEAVSELKEVLFPLVSAVTPNLEEAEALTGLRIGTLEEMEEAARLIKRRGPDVVIKGGHLEGDPVDLVLAGREIHVLRGERLKSKHTHGTGCVFSSALTVFLAEGEKLPQAARRAKAFTWKAIEGGYSCGRGSGPVNPGIVE
ncbi:MAG: bifunctional hydroxymethylpyrimidine kinase/phosphomethylpyrimidine kinase [Deltaproteobacteria bacterium]|nr:bifunctional hydroxymethylpyrimidine kinase/phosphomethylpyrimidine kinase [Deltaproteobacteria bacterium]MBW2017422.1 bifunctional hydroxymethylpyrimidine kinase/phosphomethylpyrimidine kinase [Deltaproteobacteria bacterium]MBW2127784.1 bifunctional hydroxymethylpyrimidine kinase/phosphomethylpyrimidine kinase [Deltaproteobacteria bacterium]